MRVDLNCDMGEGYGVYSFGQDEKLAGLITSANIACGYHAGDHNQMFKTVNLCLKHNVAIGAHPGYPDLAGFGRRAIDFSDQEIRNMIVYQTGALMAITRCLGGRVEHVKPHGHLYNLAARDIRTAAGVIDAVLLLDGPALVAPAGSVLAGTAETRGLKVIREGFADRHYCTDGSLVSRSQPGSVITEPQQAAERVIRMLKEHRIICQNGDETEIIVDTVCVHGDNENAVYILKEIRRVLELNKISLSRPSL